MEVLYDVLIIGAGPAGTSAALRLRQFGYRVVLVERSDAWPRNQIGEVLTPGIRNIVDLLDANEALEAVPLLAQGPSRVLWRSRSAETIAQGGSAIVNRALFDAGLLDLARRRGVEVELPARVRQASGAAGNWRIELRCGASEAKHVRARFILDASGRGGASRIDCAPPLAALWAEVDLAGLPAELASATHVEAQAHGWLWGACLPGLRRYRVMLVCDPRSARKSMPGQPEGQLRASCAASSLFGAVQHLPFASPMQMCAATPQLSPDNWQDGRIELGDAAFTLDPISSSGVEKAMRFSLQAAVAVHTLLSDQSDARASLTREFYQHRLIENCARHAYWTAAYYRQAWCADAPFWQARSSFNLRQEDEAAWPEFAARLRQTSEQLDGFHPPDLKPLAALNPRLSVRLNPMATIIDMPCVIEDRVHAHSALVHPNLERPLAFLENEALFPHLNSLRQPQFLGDVLNQFASCMPAHKARSITAWLWQHGVLDSVN